MHLQLTDGITVTSMVVINNSNNTLSSAITLPAGKTNSVVEVIGSGTPQVVVGNLNGQFLTSTTENDKGVTSADNTVVTSGGSVEIKLTAEIKDNTAANATTISATAASSAKTVGIFLDLSVLKTVRDSGGVEITSQSAILTELASLIDVFIPLPASLQGKSNYVLYRYHGSAVDSITTTANADGEKIELVDNNTTIKLTVKKFSTYAIAYTTPATAEDEAAAALATATIAVVTAETSKTNATKAVAQGLVTALPDGAGKTALQTRISAIVTAEDVTASTPPSGESSSGGNGSGTTKPKDTPVPKDTAVLVTVNGKEYSAGKETETTKDGKTTITVVVNNKTIEKIIDEAIKNNTVGIDNVIQIPIIDKNAEIVIVELTGDIIKKLEDNGFDVFVKRDNIEYVIPTKDFTISKIAEKLGIQEKDLKDITIAVKNIKIDEQMVTKLNETAMGNGAELVFSPVSFGMFAKITKPDGSINELVIDPFSGYVESIIEIADPSRVTTGIVFNQNGTYSHVPTSVYQKDGKWYASLKFLTNTNYSLIWSPITVKSVESHWSKDAVNDLASRLVIINPEKFEPNKAITRADFAEYIVRALGLYREGSTHENKFKDVSSKGEITLAILIANEYGIVSGYPDGTFRPDQEITREEAMAMYQRAMKITKLTGSDTTRYQNYTDYAKVSNWAGTYVKEVLSAHVFNGTTATTISPKSNLTYAEAAQAIKNLLVKSKLINK